MAEPTEEELATIWLSIPFNIRQWAFDQARHVEGAVEPYPLPIHGVIQTAHRIAYEVTRSPEPIIVSDFEDNGEDGQDVRDYLATVPQTDKVPPMSWKQARGLE